MILNKSYYKNINNISHKTLILAVNTYLPLDNYLKTMEHGFGGTYIKSPTFTISKDGEIYQHRKIFSHNNFLSKDTLNQKAIIVAIENLGYIKKINDKSIDWLGNEFSGSVYKRKWRGFEFWDNYTDNQLSSFNELTDYLCLTYNIKDIKMKSNVFLNLKTELAEGIFCLSNFDRSCYDLNPSYPF